MRLSKIKLSGFKSFVDPTTLNFPSNTVGIVGPNGCGKSNIIDAIRWVMGESSAKQLRGSQMSDVVFNGSRTRKPVDQASIELVFADVNVAQFPENSEIAVKRQLSRSGQSVYFLNNVRCRRKDITDLFLGTGLGPRSYAVIEQGMISRLIEAKPDELRVYLEEAAAISKYKERRKETEQRIDKTRENLDRIDDIRGELNKQLNKLKRQAKQAEKFKELQQSEKLLKAQLLAIRWHSLDITVQEQQTYLDEQSEILDTDLASLNDFDNTHKQQRQAQTIAQNTLSEVQSHFYDIETEINRLEQTIEHTNERHKQLEEDLEQIELKWSETQETLKSDQKQITELESQIETTEADLNLKQEAETLTVQALREAEEQLQDWQINWDHFNQRAAEPTQTAQVERARMQNLEQRIEENKQRLFRINEEAKDINIKDLEQAVTELDTEIAKLNTDLIEAETLLSNHQETVLNLRETIQEQSTELDQHKLQIHKLNGRLSSLETLQEASFGKAELNDWLQAQGLDELPRLAESLQVEPGWERAVEVVLGERLQALCVSNLNDLDLENPPPGNLAAFETAKFKADTTKSLLNVLIDKVQAPWNLNSLFAGILIADNITAALKLRKKLADHESVITPQGIWLGKNWLHSQQTTNENAGILARTQEIKDIISQLDQLNDKVTILSENLEQQNLIWQEHEHQREQAQQDVNQIRQQLSQLESQQAGKQARLEHIQNQLLRITNERAELSSQIEQDNINLQSTSDKLHAALEAMDKFADEREELTQQRDLFQEMVLQSNETWQTAKDERHTVDVRLEALRTDHIRLQQAIKRLTTQLEQFTHQRQDIKYNIEKQAAPLENLATELTAAQTKRTEIEENLIQAKQTVAHLEAALGDYDGERKRLEQKCNDLRAQLEQTRMEFQANQVRRQTLEEQLNETEFSPVALLGELPEDANEQAWEQKLDDVIEQLKGLSAVNLAALQEYDEQLERKQELDSQADDINQALKSLNDAIKAIDKETRIRFKQTLDQVNEFLQTMFPKLFGGGEASLQLTGDDILESGVALMARPPGKRNTHIHLLSGGEKALTAIALVFAIFELNPAPFCLLDEVDAPLDDSNVGRFSTLVKTMSERVQFIFISHNKITMEIAEQLIGITMQEAGVSRIVPVDIEAAVDMVRA
jgi:chromosome segregation protein